ncbi:VWA domain-containing protein [Candidatus Sumerlaeota bacterium]|nr:VWA domain-containing protein [Candidatus Sumerlaeota bacterium]
MRFAYPWALWLLALVPALGYVLFRLDRRKRGTLRFSDITHLKHASVPLSMRLRHIVPLLRLVVIALVIVGLARPQIGWKEDDILAEGIDIMLALDVSGSMQTQDFRPNRLEAAKRVISEFIDGRKNDRIGCVIFAATNFTLCPLTLDYGVLKDFLKRADFSTIEGLFSREFINRTAMGMGLANCIRQLKDSKAKSKVIILVTDGVNNAGQIDPLTAADMAKALGVKIHTIGVGSQGEAFMPGGLFGALQVVRAEYDEQALRKIADTTGAQFYAATDERKLREIYEQIDRMERVEFKGKQYQYYDEKMEWAIVPAFGLFLLEIGLGYTRFRKLP